MFFQNVDYVIYEHNEDDYDRVEITKRLRERLSRPENTIQSKRESIPETVSPVIGDDFSGDGQSYNPVEGKIDIMIDSSNNDHIQKKFEEYVENNALKYAKDILNKTGRVVYNSTVYARIGENCALTSHIHPEDNDGVLVLVLENKNLPLEFVLAETGRPFREKEDIPENERISLFLKTGDMLILLPHIEHLLATLPPAQESIYAAINFKIV